MKQKQKGIGERIVRIYDLYFRNVIENVYLLKNWKLLKYRKRWGLKFKSRMVSI